jgi:hypothetical protein
MRPVLQNQPQIGSLSHPLLQSLRSMLAAISTGWLFQHKGDGSHGVVTATSVEAGGLTTTGRLVGAGIARFVTPAATLTAPLVPSAPCCQVDIQTSIAAGATIVHGLSASGREHGDRVVVFNSGDGVCTIRLNSGTSAAGTRFLYGGPAASLAVAGDFSLASGQWIEAIYLPTVPAGTTSVWRLEAVAEG